MLSSLSPPPSSSGSGSSSSPNPGSSNTKFPNGSGAPGFSGADENSSSSSVFGAFFAGFAEADLDLALVDLALALVFADRPSPAAFGAAVRNLAWHELQRTALPSCSVESLNLVLHFGHATTGID